MSEAPTSMASLRPSFPAGNSRVKAAALQSLRALGQKSRARYSASGRLSVAVPLAARNVLR